MSIVKSVFRGLNWVEVLHLFKMARGFFGETEAGATPTGTVPEGGIADKSFKDWGDERIILPLLMKLPTADRLLITNFLKELSPYERNGFRQVVSGVSSGRTIVVKTSKKGGKGQSSETREEKKEPDFTDKDLRVQVLREIASMLRDNKVGEDGVKDFLRAIGTLPGESPWEKVQSKMIELYNSGILDNIDFEAKTKTLRIYQYIGVWFVIAIIFLGIFGYGFAWGLKIWGAVFGLTSIGLITMFMRRKK